MPLSNEQKIFIVEKFLETKSVSQVISLFSEKFQNSPTPARSTIYKLANKFKETGSVGDRSRSGRPRSVFNDDNKTLVAAAVVRDRSMSQVKMSLDLNLSRSSLRRIFRHFDLKCYRPAKVQKLYQGDNDRRLKFSHHIFSGSEENEDILDQIFYTDEAMIKLNGIINTKNAVYWATEKPHNYVEKDHFSRGVNVWLGIYADGFIGPFFYEGNLNGTKYLNMLNHQIYPALQEDFNFDCDNYYFQQDGAPAHTCRMVREWLDEKFEDRWIGKYGPIEWPPRSPDMNVMDFFVWGYIKEYVFSRSPATLEEIKRLITSCVLQIPRDMCKRACHSIKKRARLCIEQNGAIFEPFL